MLKGDSKCSVDRTVCGPIITREKIEKKKKKKLCCLFRKRGMNASS